MRRSLYHDYSYQFSSKQAIFVDVDLQNAELKQINLNKALLQNVDMRNANLRGATLTWKSAEGLKLDGAFYDQDTKFNIGFDPKQHNMVFVESIPTYYGTK